MRVTRPRDVPRALAALTAAVASLSFAGAADAAAISKALSYSTSGTVGLDGVTGAGVIGFSSIAGDPITTPSNISLGAFTVAHLPEGVSTTYTNTPFSITVLPHDVGGLSGTPTYAPMVVQGVLNGQVTGGSISTVVATIQPPPGTVDVATSPPPTLLVKGAGGGDYFPFPEGSYTSLLSIDSRVIPVNASSADGGRTTVRGVFSIQPAAVPEPATVAVFVTALVGLGLRRRLRPRP